MKYPLLCLTAFLAACASIKTPPTPKYDASEPHIKRWSAFKDDLLYSYRIDSRGDGFAKAAADADKWCDQHGMMVAVRVNPVCKESAYADGVTVMYCNVSFKCQ